VSDLTTLATLERIVDRACERLADETWQGETSGLRALQVLAEEIATERAGKPPHVGSP
jgi:hypothetical protein